MTPTQRPIPGLEPVEFCGPQGKRRGTSEHVQGRFHRYACRPWMVQLKKFEAKLGTVATSRHSRIGVANANPSAHHDDHGP